MNTYDQLKKQKYLIRVVLFNLLILIKIKELGEKI
jgi:hypothetical protein